MRVGVEEPIVYQEGGYIVIDTEEYYYDVYYRGHFLDSIQDYHEAMDVIERHKNEQKTRG